MPQPTRAMIHQSQPLTNISIAYTQSADAFLSTNVFPNIPVDKQLNSYYTYDIANMYRNGMQRRAPATESAGSGWTMSTDTYFCDKWALHHDITEDDRKNADAGIDLDRDAAEFLAHQKLIAKEVDWQSHYFATSIWTGSTTATDITPGNLWDTVAGTPITDMSAQAYSIKLKTGGYMPNTLILGATTFRQLKESPDIKDIIKYTQKGIVTTELLAAVFDVQKVFIADAVYNTSAESQTDSMSFICGSNDALLLYVAPNPGLKTPSAGYTFSWTGIAGNTAGQGIKKFYIDEKECDRVEINACWDHKVVSANMGCFFSNVVS